MADDEHIDYYDLLGVAPSASKKDIRNAYRKLALRWHPDKNQGSEDEAAQMFKMISEAYDVLSDDDKRTTYDRFGVEGLKGGGSSGPVFRDSTDLFREVFGDSLFSSFFRGPPTSFQQQDQPPPYPGQQAPPPPRQNGFGSSPFGDFFGGMGFGSPFSQHQQQPQRQQQTPAGFQPFADPFFASPFGSSFFSSGPMNSSFQSSSSFSSFPGSFSSISQSSSTVIRDGQRVTTTRTTRDGVTSERVETSDARTGEMLSLVVDGEAQPIGQLTDGNS